MLSASKLLQTQLIFLNNIRILLTGRRGRGGRGGNRKAVGLDEDYRIGVRSRLTKFRDSEAPELVFPAGLSPNERKFIHNVAEELGLKSKSRGRGEQRYLTVSRKSSVHVEELHIVDASIQSLTDLKGLFDIMPPSKNELNGVIKPPVMAPMKHKRNQTMAQNTKLKYVYYYEHRHLHAAKCCEILKLENDFFFANIFCFFFCFVCVH